MTALAVCGACGRPRPLTPAGTFATHKVEAAQLPGDARRRPRRRRCPGSGKLPRRVEP